MGHKRVDISRSKPEISVNVSLNRSSHNAVFIQVFHLSIFVCLCAAIPRLPPNSSLSLARPSSEWFNSSFFNASITIPTPLPYTFHIPSTPLWLHLGFGLPRKPLSQFDIGGVLALANNSLEHLIAEFGADPIIPAPHPQIRPYFRERLPPNVAFHLRPYKGNEEHFTLGAVQDVVDGLSLYLLGRRLYWWTWFVVATGRFYGSRRIYGRITADS